MKYPLKTFRPGHVIGSIIMSSGNYAQASQRMMIYPYEFSDHAEGAWKHRHNQSWLIHFMKREP